MALINPGSRIGEPGDGWTNTEAAARKSAEMWLAGMVRDGLKDIELLPGCAEREGRWIFTFRHTVTGRTAQLETHGIDNLDAYKRRHMFEPRVYWNGSSSSEPDLEDFSAPGFELVKTYRRAGETGRA